MIHSFNVQVVRLLLLFSRKDVRMRLYASGSVPIFCANDVVILMLHSFNAQVVRLLMLFSRKDVRMRWMPAVVRHLLGQ